MNVMHILATAGTGGIESLCRDYSCYSNNKNIFIVLWGKNGESANVIRKCGGSVIELDSKKKDVLKVFATLCYIVKRYSIEAVVVHHAAPIMHIYMQLLKVRYKSLKTIAYAHGSAEDMCRHDDPKGLAIRKKILEKSLKRSTIVVAISNDVKKSLIAYFGVPENKISVIYNGTDTARFTSEISAIIKKPVRLIYVGRLIEEKGIQNTIKTLSVLSKDYEWIFDIVGDGIYRRTLEELIKALNLADRIHFWGKQSDIPKLLSEHDIFIHMPKWEEGFGITVIEAMAAGTLCICLAKGGIPEIITDREDGILVNTNEELEKVLNSIFADTQDAQLYKIRCNAAKTAEKFSIEHFSEQLDELVCRV